MKKISKTEFVSLMSENETLCLGQSHDIVATADLVGCFKFNTNGGMNLAAARTVVSKGNVLRFSDGSALCVDQRNQSFYKVNENIICRKVTTADVEYGTYVWYWIV